jgi:hypothetical protein
MQITEDSLKAIRGPAIFVLSVVILCVASRCFSQDQSTPHTYKPPLDESVEGKRDTVKAARTRAFHVVPVYHWRRRGLAFVPLNPAEKAELAWDKSADRFTFIKGVFAMGISEWTNTPGAWPGGIQGVGRRYGSALAGMASDELFGTFLLPTLFHQDPRYIVTLQKPVKNQILYAVTRVVVTNTDDGRRGFNFSHVLGSLASATLTDAYYPPRDRTVNATLARWGIKLAVSAGMNTARQFLRPLVRHQPPAPSVP